MQHDFATIGDSNLILLWWPLAHHRAQRHEFPNSICHVNIDTCHFVLGGITILIMNFTHFWFKLSPMDGSWSTRLSATTMAPLVPCCLYSKARETHPAPHTTDCGGSYRHRNWEPIRGRLHPGGPTAAVYGLCPAAGRRPACEMAQRNLRPSPPRTAPQGQKSAFPHH